MHAPAWQGAPTRRSRWRATRSRSAAGADRAGLGAPRPAYRAAPPHDVVLVGYFGHLDVFLARLLAGRDKVVLRPDAVGLRHDRARPADGRDRTASRRKLARLLDRLAARQCRRAMLDTAGAPRVRRDRLGIPAKKLAIVPVGADPDALRRAPRRAGRAPEGALLRHLRAAAGHADRGRGDAADAAMRRSLHDRRHRRRTGRCSTPAPRLRRARGRSTGCRTSELPS